MAIRIEGWFHGGDGNLLRLLRATEFSILLVQTFSFQDLAKASTAIVRATRPFALYYRQGSNLCLIMPLRSAIAPLQHYTLFHPSLLAQLPPLSTLVKYRRIFVLFSIQLGHCKDVAKPLTAMYPGTCAFGNSPNAKTQPNS